MVFGLQGRLRMSSDIKKMISIEFSSLTFGRINTKQDSKLKRQLDETTT